MLKREAVVSQVGDPLVAPMFRYEPGSAWHCGWCPEVCHDEFWVRHHRMFHRQRLEQLLATTTEQYDGSMCSDPLAKGSESDG